MNKKLMCLSIFIVLGGLSGCSLFKPKMSQVQLPVSPVETSQQETYIDSQEAVVSSRYRDYSEQEYDQSQDLRRVLFFHASWCPTCKQANIDLEANADNLPDDVVVFNTDYDTQQELKKKYNITYQHTFVQVDSLGREIAKWNGGGVEQINAKVI